MSEAPEQQTKTVSEVRNVAVSFVGKLDSGELLTGTPTTAEVTTTDLTFSNQAVNTAALTINDKTVPIGMAVQFKVIGGVALSTYEITVVCGTDATPAQTLYGNVSMAVVADSD